MVDLVQKKLAAWHFRARSPEGPQLYAGLQTSRDVLDHLETYRSCLIRQMKGRIHTSSAKRGVHLWGLH